MKPVTWHWKNHLPANQMVVIIYGVEGIGKTTIVIAIIGVFTNGWNFPGTNYGVDAWPRYVYFINADGKNESLKQKLVDFGISMEYIKAPMFRYPSGHWRDPTIGDMEDIIKDLQAIRVQTGQGPALIVLDGFTSFHGQRENLSHVMTKVMMQMRRLVNVAGCPLAIIHHANKPNQFTEEIDPLFRLRGSGAQGANAEIAMMVDSHGDKLKMQVTKTNVGKKPEPIVFSIGKDKLRYHGFIEQSIIELTKEDKVAAWLNEALQRGPMPVRDIIQFAKAEFGAGKSTVYNAKDRLAIVTNTVNGSKCWALADVSKS